jgi:phosphoglycolate phosphatase
MATRTVVFDMDGTLVQTRAASWDVFQDTARRFELPVRSAEEFFELFRGNFYDSLEALCADPDIAAAVREHFLQALRERYAPSFIPGMRDVVKALAAHYPLAVMSSNAMGTIRRILEQQGLAACFAHVFSGEIGASKEEHLRHILAEPSYGNARHCSPSYVENEDRVASEVVLITDTVGDVREACNCGARAIGVAWGMHASEALLAAGAETVAMWPQEILATLLPAGGSRTDEPSCRCARDGACLTVPAASGDWPWPAVIAAGQQRRRRRASAAGDSLRVRAAGGQADDPAARPRAWASPQAGVSADDAALASAVRRISRARP